MFYIVSRPLRFEPTGGLIATATSTKTAKSNMFRLAKQQLCMCIMLFWTFLCHHCTTTTWKCLISRPSFSFPELRYSLLEFNSWKNANIGRIERDEICAIKFETARQHFWRWCYIRRFARTILSATQRSNVGTMLQPLETLSQQCCNAVLR